MNVGKMSRSGVAMTVLLGLSAGTAGAWPWGAAPDVQVKEKNGIYNLANSNLALTLGRKSGTITFLKGLSPQMAIPAACSGQVVISDAKTKNTIACAPLEDGKVKGDKLTFSATNSDATLNLRHTVKVYSNRMEWETALDNRTDARVELTVALDISFPKPPDWSFWDGAYLHDNPVSHLERVEDIDRSETETFPMACIYTKTGGLAVGLTPYQLFNFSSDLRKEADGTRHLKYAIGTVAILPHQKVSASFVLYGFNPDYGFRGAMQSYYDIYPKVFWPRSDIDPRLRQAGGIAPFLYGFFNHKKSGDEDAKMMLREESRRLYATWDWGFPTGSTYTRWGDYYGHAEKWPDWYPPREEQRQRKAEVFTTIGLDEVAMGHYVCLTVAEAGLMEKFYPDDIIRDKNGQPAVGFSQNIGGREERYYSANFFVDGQPTKIGTDTLEDMKLLAKELNLSAFSFDICYGFSSARFADYIHSLTNDKGYHVGLIENNPGDYVTAFRTDVVLLESAPYDSVELNQWRRNLDGHKMGVYLWPYRITTVVDDLAAMSPEEIKDTYFKLRDYSILMCLKMGNFPAAGHADGLPTMLRYFPILLEVCHAGWEPVVALKIQPEDESLWLSRYGKGVNSYLAVGNSTREEKTVAVQIDNPRLGDCSYLVSAIGGTPVPQTIRGTNTILSQKLPGGAPLILKSWLGIRPQGDVAASIKVLTAINRSVLTADLECSQSFATPVFLRLPDDTAIARVTLNGKSQTCREVSGSWSFKGKMKKGKNTLEIEYANRFFTDDEATLLDFPFVKDGAPVCTLALTDPENADQKYVANLLQGYFRFYCEKKENKKVLLPLAGLPEAGKAESKLVIEIKAGATAGVKRDGNTLYLQAATGDEAKDIARKLMRVLDRKYVWCPTLGDTYSQEPSSWYDLMKAKGLMGTILE